MIPTTSTLETVGFAIPSLPSRTSKLHAAVTSIAAQTHPVSDIAVAYDTTAEGAGPTRTRALRMVEAARTDWIAFLDDDDELKPGHVDALLHHAHATTADIVFPWFDVIGGTDPFPAHFGLPWEPDNPRVFPITVLARRRYLVGLEFPERPTGNWMADDWPFWAAAVARGAAISHLAERTWRWRHHGANTSGVAANVR